MATDPEFKQTLLTDEAIAQAWKEICDARPKGCVVSTIELTRQLARWVEEQVALERDTANSALDTIVNFFDHPEWAGCWTEGTMALATKITNLKNEVDELRKQSVQDATEADGYGGVMAEKKALESRVADLETQLLHANGTIRGVIHELKLNNHDGIVNQCTHLKDELDELRMARQQWSQEYLAILSYLRRVNQPVIAMALQQGRHKEAEQGN